MNTFWKLLEIEETSDLNTIKNAYRTKLISVNPEDDAEGFKNLRTAYEEALAYVNRPAETNKSQDKEASPVDEWMNMVKSVYSNFSKRVDVHSWEILLKEDVCIHLDTSNEVKEAILAFLMDHFRLPHQIYVILDDFFHFVEEKQELYEKYPKNFIDFLERSVNNEDFLDYSQFDGEEDADYDSFIRCYYELKGSLEENDVDKMSELLTQCKDYFIYHPYFMVEEARYRAKVKDHEKAEEILTGLLEEYPDDLYILYFTADIFHNSDKVEEAYQYFSKLIELCPSHYSGKLGLADCLYKKGEFEKAKEQYIEILETYPGDHYGNEGMMKVNETLILKYKEEYAANPEKIESGLELGWCLYQNLRYRECIELLDKIEPGEDHFIEYCNLKGRSLLYFEKYEMSLEYLPKWLNGLENIKEDASDELKKKKKRIGYANFTISNAYFGLAEEAKADNSELFSDYLVKALNSVSSAIEKEKDIIQRLAYQNHKTKILFQLKRYEACIDECDNILKDSETYYPAVVQRQEAYFKLEHYQNVIDDYHRAVEIYPKDEKPYLLAAKTYDEFDRYADVLAIINQAEENQIRNDELTLLKVKALRCTAEKEEDTKNVFLILEELKNKVKNNSHELERSGAPWFEAALCLKDRNQLAGALEEINSALQYNPSEADFLYCKGNILFDMDNYPGAFHIYESLLKDFPKNVNVLFKIGRVSEYLNDRKNALHYYKKVLEMNPEHGTVNHYIAEIYEAIAEETEDSSYYEKSLEHRTRQIEVNPNDYYYIERGLTLAELDRFYEAIEDYKKSIELNSQNPFPYNNIGILYKYQEQYEEAISYFKEAVKYLGEEKTSLPYNNMAACYIILNDLGMAEECYKENLKLFPGKEASYTLLAKLYRRMKLFDNAVRCYLEAITTIKNKKADFLLEIAETYDESNNPKKALSYYKEAIKEDGKNHKIYKSLGDFYFYNKKNNRKAIKCYNKAMELSKADSDEAMECLYSIGELRYYQGNKKKSEEVLNKLLDIYHKKYGSVEKYLNYNGFEAARCYNIGRIYLILGNILKAEELFERMNSCRKCNSCKYQVCFEALIGKGMIYEQEGNTNKAVSCYKEALLHDVNNSFCRFAIKRLNAHKVKTNS